MIDSKLIPLLDLTKVQKESYEEFLDQGIKDVLNEINPVTDYTGRGWKLYFDNPQILPPENSHRECIDLGLTYDAPWYVTAKLVDEKKGREKEDKVFMGEVPMMTPLGTFIINGVERTVVNQIRRSEGVFFTTSVDKKRGNILTAVRVLPRVGAWLKFETLKRKHVLSLRINQRRRIPATTLLRIFGLEQDSEIAAVFEGVNSNLEERPYIANTLEKDKSKNRQTAMLEIYRKMRPGEPVNLENASTLIKRLFFDPRRYDLSKVGRYKLNKRLGLDVSEEGEYFHLTKEDLIEIIKTMIRTNNGEEEGDDIDHLSNRRIRPVGELIKWETRVGFLQMERNIKRRISYQSRDEFSTPNKLISTRPVQARIQSFFSSSRLSQFKDQQNPLSELDHLRRVSVSGPGGITSERASFSVRDSHPTHYGRVCPVRTPEGPNIGLVTYLALFARLDEYGFLETPYYKVEETEDGKKKITDEIVYMDAAEEEKHYITDRSVAVDEDGIIQNDQVPLRQSGNFFIGGVNLVEFIDVASFQPVGASASLIPFLANDEIYRALVASNQQPQAVPLVKPEAPIVGTGMESVIAEQSGRATFAEEAGEVVELDAEHIVVENKDGDKKEYALRKFARSNQYTCHNQRVVVSLGDKVKKGDLLADGPAMENGVLALGTNLTVAYMSWAGLNYEDAVVLSERVVQDDLLTSIHINEYDVEVLETKLGPEEVTCDIPNVSEEALRNLNEDGIVTVGSKVHANDILVGKVAPKGEKELSAEERLLRAIFGEKAREVRDNSLRLPHGEHGTVIGVRTLTSQENDELKPGVIKVIRVLVAMRRKIMVGDKLAGRHGNKGVISKIVPVENMPHFKDGTPVDIILNPISILNRMNLGQVHETHLGWAGDVLDETYEVPCFSSSYKEEDIRAELKEADLPVSGKTELIDGRTGRSFDGEVLVGKTYILKLTHLAEDKMHARSIGPYTLITQQPVGGKAQFGGQRFGEMEVWALEAHSAAHALQEMLTIKSDDVVGRRKAYDAILRGEEIPEAKTPASFKLLVREMTGLGLNIETLGGEEDSFELDN